MLGQADRYKHDLRHFAEATLPTGFKFELARRTSDLYKAMRALHEDGPVAIRYDAFDMLDRVVAGIIVKLRSFCREQQWAIPSDTSDAWQELAVMIHKYADEMYREPTDRAWADLIDMTSGLRELAVFTAAQAYRERKV